MPSEGEPSPVSHHEGTFVAADGLSIYHQAWVPRAAPTAAVMLLHGLGEHSGRYAHVATTLVDAGYAVHALDHRGHGRSDGPRVYVKRYDELQRDIVQFRSIVEARHAGAPLFVLGHSMGGNLAVGHVLEHQAGVAGLALSGPAIKVGDDFSAIQLSVFRLVAKVAPGVRPRSLDAGLISRDEAVVAAYRADPLVYSGKVTAGLGAALIGAMESFPARYGELKVPILIQHGTDDRLADPAGSRELAARAVAAEVTTHFYDGLYHEIFNEPEQQAVLADLVSWLDAHGPES